MFYVSLIYLFYYFSSRPPSLALTLYNLSQYLFLFPFFCANYSLTVPTSYSPFSVLSSRPRVVSTDRVKLSVLAMQRSHSEHWQVFPEHICRLQGLHHLPPPLPLPERVRLRDRSNLLARLRHKFFFNDRVYAFQRRAADVFYSFKFES